jgi:hypothetical protein
MRRALAVVIAAAALVALAMAVGAATSGVASDASSYLSTGELVII